MRYALVYQGGLANVFRVDPDDTNPELAAFAGQPDRTRRRVLQHAFSPCEWYCRGLLAAGYTVLVYHCDEAGDIARCDWEVGPGEIFAASKHPPSKTELPK